MEVGASRCAHSFDVCRYSPLDVVPAGRDDIRCALRPVRGYRLRAQRARMPQGGAAVTGTARCSEPADEADGDADARRQRCCGLVRTTHAWCCVCVLARKGAPQFMTRVPYREPPRPDARRLAAKEFSVRVVRESDGTVVGQLSVARATDMTAVEVCVRAHASCEGVCVKMRRVGAAPRCRVPL